MRRWRATWLTLVISTLVSSASARDWYEARGARPPNGDRVYICHGYSCRIVTPVTFSPADIARLAEPLAGRTDAAGERQGVGAAVQVFEGIVGERIGTSADRAGMQFGQGRPDQMDCLDEATNTTSLLRFLADHGLLKHHTAAEPVARGFFLDGRYPHATAVLVENGSGGKWAVDSWPRANAEPPVVQPLRDWRRARPGDLPS
jgi:hypothetical protein